MQSAAGSSPADISLLDNVGGCFEAVARHWHWFEACSTSTQGTRRFWSGHCHLSPKRNPRSEGLSNVLGRTADPDQLEVFEWLQVTAARHHVYIKRFMRADEVADPAAGMTCLAASNPPQQRQGSIGCRSLRSTGFAIASNAFKWI